MFLCVDFLMATQYYFIVIVSSDPYKIETLPMVEVIHLAEKHAIQQCFFIQIHHTFTEL